MSLGPEGKTSELSNSNEPFSRKTIFDHFSYAIVNAVKVIRFKQKKCQIFSSTFVMKLLMASICLEGKIVFSN